MMDFITLLKGVNVGGNNILPMADLRTALTKAGLTDVRSYIQSGNILCQANTAADVSQVITHVLERDFHITCDIVTLAAQTWQQMVEDCPAPEDDPKLVHLYLPVNPINHLDLTPIQELAKNQERIWWRNGVFYLFTPNGFSKSKLAARLPRMMPVPITGRNLNSARKILALCTL